tara:strand:+ start:3462 stop:3971 length:510 start_codon:yes stop_codon:yes gene_type:complete
MKRELEDIDEFTVGWKTRGGILVEKKYSRKFLAKYSGFFAGFMRNSHCNYVDIKLPYPREIIQSLFKHLDGEVVNLSNRQEIMLREIIDFLALEDPYCNIQNDGFEESLCAWCSKICDTSICTAKRWFVFNGRQQCPLCAESVQYCVCVHENQHCSNIDWVSDYKRGYE